MTDDLVVSALLAPVLVTQGYYTRKVTPKLPEPAGPREGVTGKGLPLNLLVLGDSAAAGVGVQCQEEALTGHLVTKLGSSFQLEWRLLAETGLTTQQMIARLEASKSFATDCVVISLGVNDVTSGMSANSWLRQIRQLRNVLTEKFSAKQLVFSSLPPMHLFPALPQPLRWYLGRRATRFSETLGHYLTAIEDAEFVAINFPISPDYIAADGFHPSERAYDIWSGEISGVIKKRWQGN